MKDFNKQTRYGNYSYGDKIKINLEKIQHFVFAVQPFDQNIYLI